MARRLSVSTVTTNGLASTAQLEIINGTFRKLRIFSVQCFVTSAAASTFGLGITPSAAQGITPGGLTSFVSDDGLADPDFGKVAVSWGTPPSAPSIFARRISIANAVGVSWEWTFAQGFVVSQGRTLSLHNTLAGACALLAVSISAEEV